MDTKPRSADIGVGSKPTPIQHASTSPIRQQDHDPRDVATSPPPRTQDPNDTGLPTWLSSRLGAQALEPTAHRLPAGADVLASTDQEISDGEILVSSDGECFPSRQIPELAPDLFRTVFGHGANGRFVRGHGGMSSSADSSSTASSTGACRLAIVQLHICFCFVLFLFICHYFLLLRGKGSLRVPARARRGAVTYYANSQSAVYPY